MPSSKFFSCKRFNKSTKAKETSNVTNSPNATYFRISFAEELNVTDFNATNIKSMAKYPKPNKPRTISCPFSKVSKNGTIVIKEAPSNG